MARPWQEHDNMAITWQEHGKSMARAWQNMARTWQEYGKNMARAWQEHGKKHGGKNMGKDSFRARA
jgi:hypothetical protein